METTITTCNFCKKIILDESKIYRGFDATYCSAICRQKKIRIIQVIDPQFNNPNTWDTNIKRSASRQQILLSNQSRPIINTSPSYKSFPCSPVSPAQYRCFKSKNYSITNLFKQINLQFKYILTIFS